MIEGLDKDQSNKEIRFGNHIGTFEKVKKTAGYVDSVLEEMF